MDLEKTINKTETIGNMQTRDGFSEDILWKLHLTFPNMPNYLQILTDNCRKPAGGLQYEILGGSHKFQWHVEIHSHWGQYQKLHGCNNQI